MLHGECVKVTSVVLSKSVPANFNSIFPREKQINPFSILSVTTAKVKNIHLKLKTGLLSNHEFLG